MENDDILREEIDRNLVNDRKSRDEVESNQDIVSQNTCQNISDELCSSKCNAGSLTTFSAPLKRDNRAAAEILQKYFAMCDSYLTEHWNVAIGLSEERYSVDDNIEMRDGYPVIKDPDRSEYKLTHYEQPKNDQKSKEANREGQSQKLDEIIPTGITDICWDALLNSAKDKTPEKYAFVEKEKEIQFAFPASFGEDTCQRTNTCPFRGASQEEQVECNQITISTPTERLINDLLILIRQMYHAERGMLFIGLSDVISSIEQDLAEFIVLVEDATHLSTPLDFLTRLIKLAEAKDIPYIRACTKEQLGRACCMSADISVISIKIGPSYFSEEIKNIKCTITNVIPKVSSITL